MSRNVIVIRSPRPGMPEIHCDFGPHYGYDPWGDVYRELPIFAPEGLRLQREEQREVRWEIEMERERRRVRKQRRVAAQRK